MTHKEALEWVQAYDIPTTVHVNNIYEEFEEYLKAQMNDQRRDFRDRCIFREVLEYIGVNDETTK